MPIYEYRCNKCGKRFSVLTLRVGEPVTAACSRCGGRSARRLLSRFAMPKSEESRLERLSDPSSLTGLDENDPKSVARWMRRMGKEVGEEFAGEDFDEMMEGLERGEGNGDDGGEADLD